MEEVFLEIIRIFFVCAGMLLMAIVMRPAIRFLRSPMPRMHNFDPRSTLAFARKSPLFTAQTVRQWLKESPQSKSHARVT